MIEVIISKPAAEELAEHGVEVKSGLNTLTVDEAIELEQKAYDLAKATKSSKIAAVSRHLAYAFECSRTIDQVEAEIRTVLDGKWDDEDAVEAHVQLMVHRQWDRAQALSVINRVRSS